ncbi:MAG: glycosyltransferase family 2 protein [Caldisphaera sp.]
MKSLKIVKDDNMINKLLGIYIPTYNRARELNESLREFVKQCKPYRYPIYISDNGSKDGTYKIVESLQKTYPYIYYSKSTTNEGYAVNVSKVLKMGNTKYVYLASDDDKIMPNAISRITKELKTGKYSYIQVNARVYSHDLRNIIKERTISKYTDEEYGKNDYSKVLLNNKGTDYQFFMSSIILRRDIFEKELKRLNPHAPNMDFIHTMCFYNGIVNMNGKLISKPLIMIRGGNWGYSSRVMEIYFISEEIALRYIRPRYSSLAIAEIRNRPLFVLLIPVVIDRLSNNSDPDTNYKKYIKENTYINNATKKVLWLVMHMPIPILKILYNTYKIIKRY